MPLYLATCVDENAKTITETLEAANVTALRQIVEAKRLFLVSQREANRKAGGGSTRLSMKIQRDLFDVIALQLRNNVMTDVIIRKLKENFPNAAARKVLRGIDHELDISRSTLTDAMARYPRSFNEGVIESIRVSEAAVSRPSPSDSRTCATRLISDWKFAERSKGAVLSGDDRDDGVRIAGVRHARGYPKIAGIAHHASRPAAGAHARRAWRVHVHG
ncbi:hypothetical protein OH491_27680 (plasmid) [Termitidicoccus mucosus]|uniref:hypothetical protein n=1 Tax=Termitidicoccus mucosus TaxID=1184151 RepID=UPI003182D016